MLADQVLTGWLVFIRLQWGAERKPFVPPEVTSSLIEKGWLELAGQNLSVTRSGCVHSDLEAPTWGVNPIPQEQS